jgi:hypothetical protein
MNRAPAIEWGKLWEQTLPGPWELAAIGVGLVALLWLTFRVRAYFRDDDAGSGHASDLLTDLSEMHRQGGLSEEEFRWIKTRLVRGSAKDQSPPPPPAKPAGDGA